MNLRDEPTSRENAMYPCFSSCRVSHDNDGLVYDNRTPTIEPIPELIVTRDVVLPYYFSIGLIGRGGLWFRSFYRPASPWDQRKNVIIWRGSTTGTWEASPRFWLFQREHDIPNVETDFAFMRVVQNRGQELPSKYRQADSMSYSDIQQHKYLLDVDGNAFTERFPKLLLSGSLVFKSTKFGEWFSERVQPWVDFILVNYNQSDLDEKVKWVHAHQSLAQSIAEHGKETAQRHLRPQDQQCYAYRLLLEYHSLFES